MLTQYVTVLQGTLAPALLIMALNVMLTVGEGRDKPLSAYWRLAGFIIGFAGCHCVRRVACIRDDQSAYVRQLPYVVVLCDFRYRSVRCCAVRTSHHYELA